MYLKNEGRNLLGRICNDLNIIRDSNYNLNIDDFKDYLHKIIFSVLNNLALEKDINKADGITIANYLKNFNVQYEYFISNQGVDFVDTIMENSQFLSTDYCYKMVKKMSLLTAYKENGLDISYYYIQDGLDVKKIDEAFTRLQNASIEDIKSYFKAKVIEVEKKFETQEGSYSFEAKDGLNELIEEFKKGVSWGLPFKSKFLNTIYSGMKLSKFIIRSGGTGSGKTRLALADLCNISCPKLWDAKTEKWRINEHIVSGLFISTELTKKEVQLILLATISGINEDIIAKGIYTKPVATRIYEAKEILENSKIYCEYIADFSTEDIKNIIEQNYIKYGIKYVFFDYMQITSKLAMEMKRKFGSAQRDDQMLNQLSTSLKNISNRLDLFIISATQLNRNYKTDGYIDATHIRGGMATLDKTDGAIIILKATKLDLEKIQPIIENNYAKIPTHAFHIIKNRGGRWVGVIVWVKLNLGIMDIEDCFVTTQDHELIEDIAQVDLAM